LERCEVAAGGRVDAIRLSGGAAKSDLWNQIKANVHGRPVEVLSELDTGARGAALIVGRAIELTDDLEEWSSDLAHVRITMEPSASDAARHDQGYEIYRNAYQALEPVFAANQGAPHV
jgi:xylulokinase